MNQPLPKINEKVKVTTGTDYDCMVYRMTLEDHRGD